MQGAGVLVAIVAVLVTAAAATTAAAPFESCSVRYANASRKPLLFGGVLDRCVAGCASRTSQWGEICAFKHEDDPKMVCTPSAANHSFALAETLGGGEAMQLSPCDLVRYLRGRTLWLIGDSHARFFYRALQCFLLDFWDTSRECQATLDSEANVQLANMPAAPGGAYCFHLLGPATGRVCMVHVVLGTSLVDNPQVAEGGVLPLLHKKFAQPQDIFYINFGIWHKNLEEHESSFVPALEALGRFYKATKSRFPHVVFGETPAQHQRTGDGTQCAAAKGFTYDAASGLLMTTTAVNAALRSTGSGAAANAGSATAAAAPPAAAAAAAAAAANSTARVAASNAAAAFATNVPAKSFSATSIVVSNIVPARSNSATMVTQAANTATVNVTAAHAASVVAQSANAATASVAAAKAGTAAGWKLQGTTASTGSTAATAPAAAGVKASVVDVSDVAAINIYSATAVNATIRAAGNDASHAAAAASTASLPNSVTITPADSTAAGAAESDTAGNGSAAAAANAAAVHFNSTRTAQSGATTVRPSGIATATTLNKDTLLSVANATARPSANAENSLTGDAAAAVAVKAENAAAAVQAASAYQQAWDLGIIINQLADEVLARQGLPVLPFFNITVPLYDNHASVPLESGKLDCMHYCHPGAPEMWVWYLYDFLRSPQGVQPLPNNANANYSLPCKAMNSAP